MNNSDFLNDKTKKRKQKFDQPPDTKKRIIFFNDPPIFNPVFQNIPFIQPVPNIIEKICRNPLCDHFVFSKKINILKHQMNSIKKVDTIDDLIALGKTFHCKLNTSYNGLNLRIICNLIEPLTELNKMIGMSTVKKSIIGNIIYFLQDLNNTEKCNICIDCVNNFPCIRNNNNMLHTIITGPPGVGKTLVGKILGKIYKEMGILSKGHFRVVTRSDLIGKYLGHTAAKTQEVINECRGGIMFIDEAYSLGNNESSDSFSKECIDTINQNLTECRDLLCIIAGYEKALNKCFFSYNDGLKRRFPFRYNISKYSSTELRDMFIQKVFDDNWNLDPSIYKLENCTKIIDDKFTDIFKDNESFFTYYGGDIETLLFYSKLCHGKRVLLMDVKYKRILNIDDIIEGFSMLKEYKNIKNKSDDFSKLMMYV